MGDARRRSLSFLTWVTNARIALVPVVVVLVLAGQRSRAAAIAGALLFLAGATTDFIDGYLARRWRLTTTFGSFLDTTADKLLVSSALIALVAVGSTSPWVAVAIVSRELVLLGLRAAAADSGTVVQPSLLGKTKANVQFLAVFLAILPWAAKAGPLRVDEWAMLVAVVVTVGSGLHYLWRLSPVLRSSRVRH